MHTVPVGKRPLSDHSRSQRKKKYNSQQTNKRQTTNYSKKYESLYLKHFFSTVNSYKLKWHSMRIALYMSWIFYTWLQIYPSIRKTDISDLLTTSLLVVHISKPILLSRPTVKDFSSYPNMDTSSDMEHPFDSKIGQDLCLSPVVKLLSVESWRSFGFVP